MTLNSLSTRSELSVARKSLKTHRTRRGGKSRTRRMKMYIETLENERLLCEATTAYQEEPEFILAPSYQEYQDDMHLLHEAITAYQKETAIMFGSHEFYVC